MNDLDFLPSPLAGAFFGGPTAPGYTVPRPQVEDYIRWAATRRGIAPGVALGAFGGEGASNWQSTFHKGGKREKSYGPYQLFTEGGLGNTFQAETGLDPSNPSTWKSNIDYSLDKAAEEGWAPWYGWKGDKWAGLEGAKALGKSMWAPWLQASGDVSGLPGIGDESGGEVEMTPAKGPAETSALAKIMSLLQSPALLGAKAGAPMSLIGGAEASAPGTALEIEPPPGPAPTKVKTVDIKGPPANTAFMGEAAPAQTGYVPQTLDATGLVDLYKQRLDHLGEDDDETLTEAIGRMLTNFGAGAFTSASNISGRSVGPGIFESLGGGAAAMGLGEQSQRSAEAERADKRDERTYSTLSDLMKLHLELQKSHEDQRYKAAELGLRGGYYDMLGKKGGNELVNRVITALGQGADPEEIIQFLTAIGQGDPEVLKMIKGLETTPAGP